MIKTDKPIRNDTVKQTDRQTVISTYYKHINTFNTLTKRNMLNVSQHSKPSSESCIKTKYKLASVSLQPF